MRLAILYPELANRDCTYCLTYRHDQYGPIRMPDGAPIKRFAATPPDCRKGGCPKGTPEQQRTLSADNRLCYNHYRRCRAIGEWPNDPLVAYHARVLMEVERECSDAKHLQAMREMFAR